MLQIGIISVSVLLYLLTFAFAIFIFYHQYREQSLLHAIAGFFISPYGYIWAWLNAKRLDFIDVMVAGTIVFILTIAFPLVLAFQATNNLIAESIDQGVVIVPSQSEGTTKTGEDGSISFSTGISTMRDGTPKGTVSLNQPVRDTIDGFLDIHDWSFDGQAGQTITIQVNPIDGSNPDPRVGILDANGNLLIEDDDSGANLGALIQSYQLPANGTYTIRVDGWNEGSYELTIN
ncbi:MAG: PPC domain-containing protein [Chloroflexota bacterium]